MLFKGRASLSHATAPETCPTLVGDFVEPDPLAPALEAVALVMAQSADSDQSPCDQVASEAAVVAVSIRQWITEADAIDH